MGTPHRTETDGEGAIEAGPDRDARDVQVLGVHGRAEAGELEGGRRRLRKLRIDRREAANLSRRRLRRRERSRLRQPLARHRGRGRGGAGGDERRGEARGSGVAGEHPNDEDRSRGSQRFHAAIRRRRRGHRSSRERRRDRGEVRIGGEPDPRRSARGAVGRRDGEMARFAAERLGRGRLGGGTPGPFRLPAAGRSRPARSHH
mmetsp:Transcript_4830/g.21546  ORF Transcript_4830/g.21546 Transcript_4830/m.21546 type:complete len:203 (-) Transcript_4830:794-1402(-)